MELATETHTYSQTLHCSELMYSWSGHSEATGLDFHSRLHFYAFVHHKEGVGRVVTTKTHLFPLSELMCRFGCTPSFIIYSYPFFVLSANVTKPTLTAVCIQTCTLQTRIFTWGRTCPIFSFQGFITYLKVIHFWSALLSINFNNSLLNDSSRLLIFFIYLPLSCLIHSSMILFPIFYFGLVCFVFLSWLLQHILLASEKQLRLLVDHTTLIF